MLAEFSKRLADFTRKSFRLSESRRKTKKTKNISRQVFGHSIASVYLCRTKPCFGLRLRFPTFCVGLRGNAVQLGDSPRCCESFRPVNLMKATASERCGKVFTCKTSQKTCRFRSMHTFSSRELELRSASQHTYIGQCRRHLPFPSSKTDGPPLR